MKINFVFILIMSSMQWTKHFNKLWLIKSCVQFTLNNIVYGLYQFGKSLIFNLLDYSFIPFNISSLQSLIWEMVRKNWWRWKKWWWKNEPTENWRRLLCTTLEWLKIDFYNKKNLVILYHSSFSFYLLYYTSRMLSRSIWC